MLNKSIQCSNCSSIGHGSKQCTYPITSYGVILFRVRDCSWNQTDVLLKQDKPTITGFEQFDSGLEFFMIQRRDSIGFVEIMRGKYRITDIDYIRQQIAGMTGKEREKLLSQPFDTLWEDLWGSPQDGSHNYKNEKDQARMKLESLKAGTPSLQQLIQESTPAWLTPEWGFPKGRRDPNESEYACAMRELWEETNIREKDILPIRNLDPLEETFFGSNQVQYCHKYFIAHAPSKGVGELTLQEAATLNRHISREIGSMGWFPIERALMLIRPENVEKRELLLRVSSLLRNYCPLKLSNLPQPARKSRAY